MICSIDPTTENVHVRRWETHLQPRHIPAFLHDDADVPGELTARSNASASSLSNSKSPSRSSSTDIDTFGDIAGVEKIDRGWLTTETVFQFKFFRNPFMLKQKLKNKLLYVKVSCKFYYFSFYIFPHLLEAFILYMVSIEIETICHFIYN